MKTLNPFVAFSLFFFFFQTNVNAQQREPDPYDSVLSYAMPKWWTIIEAGFQSGLGDVEVEGRSFENKSLLPGFRLINLFMIHPNVSIGYGIGLQEYDEGMMMPLFLDMRAYLGRRKFMPMAVLDAGYSFGWPGEEGDREWVGLMINPGIGFVIKYAEKGALFFRAGYRLQHIYYDVSFNMIKVPKDYLSIHAGIKF